MAQTKAHLIKDYKEIDINEVKSSNNILITASASTRDEELIEVFNFLNNLKK